MKRGALAPTVTSAKILSSSHGPRQDATWENSRKVNQALSCEHTVASSFLSVNRKLQPPLCTFGHSGTSVLRATRVRRNSEKSLGLDRSRLTLPPARLRPDIELSVEPGGRAFVTRGANGAASARRGDRARPVPEGGDDPQTKHGAVAFELHVVVVLAQVHVAEKGDLAEPGAGEG